jgi:hypothetical protein
LQKYSGKKKVCPSEHREEIQRVIAALMRQIFLDSSLVSAATRGERPTFRMALFSSACARFETVLQPNSIQELAEILVSKVVEDAPHSMQLKNRRKVSSILPIQNALP